MNSIDTRIEFGTTLTFTQNSMPSIVSYVDYSCSSFDLCDRHFLIERALPLLRTDNNPLHTNLVALWNKSSTTPSICDVQVRTERCSSYLCFVVYEELKHLNYDNTECNRQELTHPIHIYVRTLTNYRAQSTVEQQYRCMKNDCRGQIAFNFLSKHNPVNESSMSQQIDDTKELNQIIFKQTIIIVGILLVIASIAYYIQCRAYRQGYQLTIITA
jgi:hypothetical protein